MQPQRPLISTGYTLISTSGYGTASATCARRWAFVQCYAVRGPKRRMLRFWLGCVILFLRHMCEVYSLPISHLNLQAHAPSAGLCSLVMMRLVKRNLGLRGSNLQAAMLELFALQLRIQSLDQPLGPSVRLRHEGPTPNCLTVASLNADSRVLGCLAVALQLPPRYSVAQSSRWPSPCRNEPNLCYNPIPDLRNLSQSQSSGPESTSAQSEHHLQPVRARPAAAKYGSGPEPSLAFRIPMLMAESGLLLRSLSQVTIVWIYDKIIWFWNYGNLN